LSRSIADVLPDLEVGDVLPLPEFLLFADALLLLLLPVFERLELLLPLPWRFPEFDFVVAIFFILIVFKN
jgi:hypothetical protein